MRLTAIKLAGFKSFVDPTTLPLDANLTGIVGPNGCGKSNVIDAVRWVTGESSAKQLRGEALEDVIFNGSKGRKPVGRVAVELRFDNSAGKLGGQYARFNEIAIRRELTREGGSRYFINGARARRRDVVDLFLGTGLGGRSNYAVIEQGAVNRLIEAKPEQLRQVLEEAAGISRYKERRRETENRIRHTRENLDRLNDLIGEVTQRLATLKRQARNAERYKTLKQDERRLRAELLALRWQALDADVQKASAELRQREQALATAISGQRQAQHDRERSTAAQQAASDACQRHQTAFYDAQAEATRIGQALEHARQLCEMRRRERDELDERRARLETRELEEQSALAIAHQNIEQMESEYAANQQACDASRKRLDAAEQAVEQAEQQWEAHNSGGPPPEAQLEAEKTQHGYLGKRMEQSRLALDKTGAEIEQLARDDTQSALQILDTQVQKLTAQVATDEARVQAYGEQYTTLAETEKALLSQLEQTRAGLAEQQARLASEKAMQQAALREDDTMVREWLATQGQGEIRSLARLVEAPPAWQTAVEAALGDWLAGFAVDRLPGANQQWPEQALTLIETGSTDASTDAPALAGLPCLANRIKAPAPIVAAAREVFVAADVDSALAARSQLAPGQVIVSLEGVRVGAAFLSIPASQAPGHGILEREQNIRLLSRQCEADAKRLEARQQEHDAQRQQLQTIGAQRQALEQTLAETRRELAHKRAEQQGLQTRLTQRRQRASELNAEQERLRLQLEHDQEAVQALATRITELSKQAETHAHNRAAVQRALAAARESRNTLRRQFEEAETGLRQIEQKLAAARSHYTNLTSRLEDTHATRTQIAERLAAFDAQSDADTATQAPDESTHEAAKARRLAAEQALREARDTLRTTEQHSAQAARDVLQADQRVDAARESMQQARITVETASARRDGMGEQLAELDADAGDLLQNIDAQATVAAWQSRIDNLEGKIARLGAINLAAIEEYEVEAEREQYLATQHADLSAALTTLESAIAKIDRETRTRFRATFEQVNQRFAAMFPTLFGGGRAALELTEEDLLSTGVRVVARPPGKRNATIQMLSGGEKAMTAVALLFALFELNPAPFCMLDEIDAPLDDANVARFCELVRQMSADIQFVVITHNKLTMELAEQLHGVTMLEPGVSRLVSVNMDEALDLAG